ncbi:MAG: class I SAM-dependent methyltransferase [Proteobacteria bacterium]|nr:class I SAM-dependent methyltransferase [Pseudomonadota bacterium]
MILSEWKLKNATQAEIDHWRTPDKIFYYLSYRWGLAGFADFLDLGCFIGRHAIPAAAAGFRVSAIDANADAVKYAENWAQSENVAVEFKAGDTQMLPYPDAKFDCAMASHIVTLTDSDGVRKNLDEISRVLKQGGEAYMTLDARESRGFTVDGAITVDKNTKRMPENVGMDSGTTHFFANDKMLNELLRGFEIINKELVFWLFDNGKKTVRGPAHYNILARKSGGR